MDGLDNDDKDADDVCSQISHDEIWNISASFLEFVEEKKLEPVKPKKDEKMKIFQKTIRDEKKKKVEETMQARIEAVKRNRNRYQ